MYIITYEEYSEYNQFEGSWGWQVDERRSLKVAKEYVEALKKGNCCRKIKLSKVIDE